MGGDWETESNKRLHENLQEDEQEDPHSLEPAQRIEVYNSFFLSLLVILLFSLSSFVGANHQHPKEDLKLTLD